VRIYWVREQAVKERPPERRLYYFGAFWKNYKKRVVHKAPWGVSIRGQRVSAARGSGCSTYRISLLQ